MILWIVLTLMIALAVVGLAIPLIRPGGVLDRRTTSAEVLKAQLADLDRQAEAGTVPAEDIAALRLETERRALAEGVEVAPDSRPLGEKALLRLALGLAAVVALAQTVMRSEIGKLSLDKTFEERDALNDAIVRSVQGAAAAWGLQCMR